ncbi:hypothetical protein C1H46_002276 [Malus baccata]|uniref:Uncharacterized protein n=1 Tax=Malus baccata TaxID=106549 RepID=A0A540NN62_MALBA|nr:hypothetical protein C1H46_002276 [Malus baccata]
MSQKNDDYLANLSQQQQTRQWRELTPNLEVSLHLQMDGGRQKGNKLCCQGSGRVWHLMGSYSSSSSSDRDVFQIAAGGDGASALCVPPVIFHYNLVVEEDKRGVVTPCFAGGLRF